AKAVPSPTSGARATPPPSPPPWRRRNERGDTKRMFVADDSMHAQRTRSYPPPCGEGGEHAGKLAQPAQAWLRLRAGWGSCGDSQVSPQRQTPTPNPSPPQVGLARLAQG